MTKLSFFQIEKKTFLEQSDKNFFFNFGKKMDFAIFWSKIDFND